ncbi:MAG: DEAD/DEAH box helicase [Gammaproteobacteria bacterium]|nr:DEAD/DEAH box helicase [Gammaproteobacteria bacterium]
MTNKHLTDQKFTDFNLSESLQRGLDEAGFELCTPIQAQSIPVALSGTDVAGQAQTGTGKTIAFLLACFQHLITNPAPKGQTKPQVRSLVLAPTRELAIQIYKDAQVLSKYTELKLGLAYGGTDYEGQKKMLDEGVDILIGTPGRLIDFFKQRLFDLSSTQVAILDEADRMLDLGFIKDIRFLLRKMPDASTRLNLLFSATLSYRVMELAYEHMNNPREIKIESETMVAEQVEEYSYYPADTEKLPLLVNLIKAQQPGRVVVFANTKHCVETVSETLLANGISSAALSGDVPQNKREKLLDNFKSQAQSVLVATDVAARGLHIPEVSHVFNFDLPNDADDYIHRIGRTARAGESGEAISFVCEKYAYSIMDIEEHIGHSIPKKELTENLLVEITRAKPVSRNSRPKSKPRPKTENKSTKRMEEKSASEQEQTSLFSTKTAGTIPATEATSSAQGISSKLPGVRNNTASIGNTIHKRRFSRRFGEIPAIG